VREREGGRGCQREVEADKAALAGPASPENKNKGCKHNSRPRSFACVCLQKVGVGGSYVTRKGDWTHEGSEQGGTSIDSGGMRDCFEFCRGTDVSFFLIRMPS
jgi:hypothetical protein